MSDRFDLLEHPIVHNGPAVLSGFSAWIEHIPFGWLLIELAKPSSIVELGTHYGDAYLSFCQAVKALKLPARCWAVDTWIGDKHSGPYGPEVLQHVRTHHDPHYASFSTLLQKDFDSAVKDFSDGQIDLLHIDGLHTYEAVRRDFDAWLPKMSRRGVVMLHDTQVRTGDFGVWRVWEEVSRGRPSFEFEHAYGLGAVVVGSEPEPELLRFFEYANANAPGVRAFFASLGSRIEAMRRLSVLTNMLLRQGSMLQPILAARATTWTLPTTFEPAFVQILPFCNALNGVIEAVCQEHKQMFQILKSRQNQTP